jgi:hypothetical protein
MKLITKVLGLIVIVAISLDGIGAEVRTSSGTPKIGDKYQSIITLDSKKKLILPEGVWEVNNVFDDREGNWHATWKVINLINEDPNSPFRMMIIRYFSTSTSRWPSDDCEKKSDQYAFGQDTTGSKGSRSVCSSFFIWNNPQELITLTLPKFYNFYWGKALSKLPPTFIQSLPKEMLALLLVSSQNNGLLVRQDILFDPNKVGISADDFKRTFSSNVEEPAKKSLLNWRVNYAQAMAQAFHDSLDIQSDVYSLKIQTAPPLAKDSEPKSPSKNEPLDASQAPAVSSTLSNSEKQLAIEREKLEQEKLIFEQQKKLAEEKRRFEEEKKQAEIESIRRQKEILALQEEREKLEKLQENKRRNDDELALKAEKRKQIEDEKRQAADARKAAEEEKKKLEAQRKTPPTIEVVQSDPDEYGAVILEITVSKPTKSLLINGENEGASADGKYRVKRILKKNGKTSFTFVASDDSGNKATFNWAGELKAVSKIAEKKPSNIDNGGNESSSSKNQNKIVESEYIKKNKETFACTTFHIMLFHNSFKALQLRNPEFVFPKNWYDGKNFNQNMTCAILGGDGEKTFMISFALGRNHNSFEELISEFDKNGLTISHHAQSKGTFIDTNKSMCFSAVLSSKDSGKNVVGLLFKEGGSPLFLPVQDCPKGYPTTD